MSILIQSICLSYYALAAIIASDAPSDRSIIESLKAQDFKIRSQQNPERFRMLEDIRVSGSAQFSNQSLRKIIKRINARKQYSIVIFDVRQEMHLLGYNDLSSIIAEKDGSEINHGLNFIIRDEDALSKQGTLGREEIITQACGLQYVRIPVMDDSVPTRADVDVFLNAYKEKTQQDPNTWFHVHCEHGHGRTTTFMSMLHILNTQGKTSLSNILNEQQQNGGADLAFPSQQSADIKGADLQQKRYAFLEAFHHYVNDKKNGFATGKSWSEWQATIN